MGQARARATWVLPATLLLALGCELRDHGPGDVATAFWSALRSNDLEAAGALATAGDARSLEGLVDAGGIEAVTLGQVLANESAASVETSVVFAGREGALRFDTHLARVDDAWKVDVARTREEMRRTALASSIEAAERALREGAEVVGEALEEGLRNASDALREALEELERSLEGRQSL